MQIIQFLVGATYASLHSFISYTIPVRVLSSPGAAVKSASASAFSLMAQATATGFAAMAKKMLFRAAGEEGLAENVGVPSATPSARVNPHPHHPVSPVYHTEYKTVPCIDTSGQTFAIWLNVFYLTPLTVLFVRFFIRAYLRRTGAGKKSGTIDRKAIQAEGQQDEIDAANGAAKDALKGLTRELDSERPNGDAKLANGFKTDVKDAEKMLEEMRKQAINELYQNGNGKANGNGHINGKAKH